MVSYTQAAVERAMKVQEVILKAMAGSLGRWGQPRSSALRSDDEAVAGYFVPLTQQLRCCFRHSCHKSSIAQSAYRSLNSVPHDRGEKQEVAVSKIQ